MKVAYKFEDAQRDVDRVSRAYALCALKLIGWDENANEERGLFYDECNVCMYENRCPTRVCHPGPEWCARIPGSQPDHVVRVDLKRQVKEGGSAPVHGRVSAHGSVPVKRQRMVDEDEEDSATSGAAAHGSDPVKRHRRIEEGGEEDVSCSVTESADTAMVGSELACLARLPIVHGAFLGVDYTRVYGEEVCRKIAHLFFGPKREDYLGLSVLQDSKNDLGVAIHEYNRWVDFEVVKVDLAAGCQNVFTGPNVQYWIGCRLMHKTPLSVQMPERWAEREDLMEYRV